MRDIIGCLLYGNLFRRAAPELLPLHVKLAVFNLRRQCVETARGGPTQDSAVGCINATVAGTFKMAAYGIPVIKTSEMGANGGEHGYLGITVLDCP
jgi:hypothetical protein